MSERQRVRDPIHGLITFNKGNKIDQVAWDLIQTNEFQRLRRIRQLGVSEFVFPSATHTRFSHSIGVFHNARRMMSIVKSEEGRGFNSEKADVVLIASLLHDLGHGPFSHTFEGAREKIAFSRGISKIDKHERFSAEIIRRTSGSVFDVLKRHGFEEAAEEAANLLEADNPQDIYHAVVSSSFDADRLDYLVRDRYMTGTGTGAIDHEWLLDNLTKHKIRIDQDDDPDPQFINTFIFKAKGRQAAEDFLLARFRLYNQVYLHKTTRGFEELISALLVIIGENSIDPTHIGLDESNLLVRFLRHDTPTVSDYLPLDDYIVWNAIALISRSSHVQAALLATRILNRERMTVIDVSNEYGHNIEKIENAVESLDNHVSDKIGLSVFKDEAPYNLYSKANGESTKAHKIIRVKTGDGDHKEITEFSETIVNKQLTQKRNLIRYYFLNESDRSEAHKVMKGG